MNRFSHKRTPLVSLLAVSVLLLGITPAGAQVTTTEFSASISVDPESPYLMQLARLTLTLEAVGGPIHGIVVTAAESFAGPTEVIGNGDSVLEPGETWQYQATSAVQAGDSSATISGLDENESQVTIDVFLNYADSILEPMEATIIPSAMQVGAGDEVTWTLLVENVGPYGITGLTADARLLYDGWIGPIPYEPMTGPSVVMGDGDGLFEPGEQWEYVYTSALFWTGYADVMLSGAPDYSPLSFFGIDVPIVPVEVIAGGADGGDGADGGNGDEVADIESLPFTGVPVAGLSLAGAVATLLGAAVVLLNRKR